MTEPFICFLFQGLPSGSTKVYSSAMMQFNASSSLALEACTQMSKNWFTLSGESRFSFASSAILSIGALLSVLMEMLLSIKRILSRKNKTQRPRSACARRNRAGEKLTPRSAGNDRWGKVPDLYQIFDPGQFRYAPA